MKARRPHSTITIVIVTVCSLILTAIAVCAESDYSAGGRPKIGLVLSGGGARGAAHIGVLRVLEEQRVPIDYITGTSAGAAVGGLYAMGLSTDEIEETLASVDWDDTFQDLPPRRFRSFRRKTDDYLFLVKKRPGFNNGKLRFPSGLIQGQKMDLILTAATLPAVGVSDFDSLPIPFRSVAAEVATGREVVLGSGNLGRAIRASMTVPIVFSPLVINGQSLVDGGIVNNLPINVAQDMGADIIIAVDIGTPLADKEAISSAIDIGIQLSIFLARRGTDEQIGLLEPNDLLLVPELTDYSNSDFKIFREIIPYGRLAAEANLKTIQQWSLPEEAYQSYRDSVSRPKAPQPVINFVDVENDSRLADDVILSKLGGLDIGAPLNVQSLEQGIANVYGLELFQNIRYEVVQKDGVTGLKIDVEERSWGPNYIQFGTEYNSNSDGNSVFGISFGYLKTAINSFSGEWRTTVTLGEEPEIETEWYQPLGAGSAAFIVPTLRFGQQLINIYEDGNLLTELRVREAHAELAAGRTIGNWGELRFGARFANGEYKVRVGDPSIPDFDSRLGEAFVRLSADILDDVSFPTSGVAARGEWLDSRDELGADSNFNQIQFSGIAATSRNSNSLLVHARYGSTTKGIAPIQSLFQLGGYLDLSGFNEDELTGQNVARVGATVFHRFVNSGMLTAYLGLSAEVGNVWDRTEEITYGGSNWGGSVWLGAKTKLGPIIISYGTAESRRNAFYFILGHNLI